MFLVLLQVSVIKQENQVLSLMEFMYFGEKGGWRQNIKIMETRKCINDHQVRINTIKVRLSCQWDGELLVRGLQLNRVVWKGLSEEATEVREQVIHAEEQSRHREQQTLLQMNINQPRGQHDYIRAREKQNDWKNGGRNSQGPDYKCILQAAVKTMDFFPESGRNSPEGFEHGSDTI